MHPYSARDDVSAHKRKARHRCNKCYHWPVDNNGNLRCSNGHTLPLAAIVAKMLGDSGIFAHDKRRPVLHDIGLIEAVLDDRSLDRTEINAVNLTCDDVLSNNCSCNVVVSSMLVHDCQAEGRVQVLPLIRIHMSQHPKALTKFRHMLIQLLLNIARQVEEEDRAAEEEMLSHPASIGRPANGRRVNIPFHSDQGRENKLASL